MRGVVVDSSVAVAWVLGDETLHERAVRFRETIETGELEPIVASHFGFEIRSALMQAARRGRIDWDSVLPRTAAIDAFALTVTAIRGGDEAVVRIARELSVSWADALWIQLAVETDLPLVTVDRRLATRVPASVAIVVPLGDLPGGA